MRWLRALLLVLLAASLAAGPARAQPTEMAVKAAFLPKFARYVSWPPRAMPQSGQPYQLCLVGRDPFGDMIDRAAAGEIVGGRRVAVRRVAGVAGATGCHMAFVYGENSEATARILSALRGHGVLTVTDARAGPARGMIHFVVSGGRVRFYIDEMEAGRAGLSISSRLLSLALGVRQRRG